LVIHLKQSEFSRPLKYAFNFEKISKPPKQLIVGGFNFGGLDMSPRVFLANDKNGSLGTYCTGTTEWVSDSRVICRKGAPAGTGNFLSVFVNVSGQIGSSKALFSYNVPAIDSVTKAATKGAPTEGGTTITLTGLNFGLDENAIQVSVDNSNCPITLAALASSPASIQCTLPAGSGHPRIGIYLKYFFCHFIYLLLKFSQCSHLRLIIIC
jgi:hypothetical protein